MMGKSKSNKSKGSRKTYEADMDMVEIRPVCPRPGCGSRKIAKDNGTQSMPGYPLHINGECVGKWVSTRRVVCECGQHYRIKVVEAPAAAEK